MQGCPSVLSEGEKSKSGQKLGKDKRQSDPFFKFKSGQNYWGGGT